MTFEGKFIHKEGAGKVTIGIIVLCSSWNLIGTGVDPTPIWEDDCSQKHFKVKNEISFPCVDNLLYMVTSLYFDWKLSFFYGLFFLLPSVCVFLIESWDFGLKFYCVYLSQFLEV